MGLEEAVRGVASDLVTLARVAALHIVVYGLVQVGPMVMTGDAGRGSFPVIVNSGSVIVGHRYDELAEGARDEKPCMVFV